MVESLLCFAGHSVSRAVQGIELSSHESLGNLLKGILLSIDADCTDGDYRVAITEALLSSSFPQMLAHARSMSLLASLDTAMRLHSSWSVPSDLTVTVLPGAKRETRRIVISRVHAG